MKQWLPSILICANLFAVLLIFIIQPLGHSPERKRIRDMRPFLLALGGGGDGSSTPSGGDEGGGGGSSGGGSEGSGSSGGSASGELSGTQEISCFDEFYPSPFWQTIGKKDGIPANDPINIVSAIIKICVYAQNAITGKFGGDVIALNDAAGQIQAIKSAFLGRTPGADNAVAYLYLKQGRDTFQKFVATTLTNDYLLNPLPYVAQLKKDLENLLPKKTAPVEAPAVPPPGLQAPAPQPQQQPEAAIFQPPQAPALPESPIAAAARKFIKKIETLFDLRTKGIKRNGTGRIIKAQKFKTDVTRLIQFFYFANRGE